MLRIVFPLALLSTMAIGAQDRQDPTEVFSIKEEAAHIEYTATSGEAVIVFEAESESVMRNVQIVQPDGTPVLRLWAAAGAEARISGFIVETGEDSAEGLLASYAAGRYSMVAESAEGIRAEGGAELSHVLLPAPTVLYPLEGSIGISTTATITWLPDSSAVEYRVVLEQDENDGLTARLPAGTSTFQVPAGILRPATLSHVEIGAVDQSGNVTYVEVEFHTL